MFNANCALKALLTARAPQFNVTSVAFHPGKPLLAVGAVNKTVTVFDLRKTEDVLASIEGVHANAVSHVRFSTSPDDALTRLFTSSTDAVVRAFLARSAACTSWRLDREHRGHADARHFTGLSVSMSTGLVAAGSETEEVVLYARGATSPVASMPVGGAVLDGPTTAGFVSTVAFRQDAGRGESDTLAAANSAGTVRIFNIEA